MEVTTLYMCQKIEDLVMQDKFIKVSTISQECNILEQSTMAILHEHMTCQMSFPNGFQEY